MSKTLATAIHLTDDSGVVHSFLPGTKPPKWARDLIDNPKAWAAEEDGPTTDDAEPLPAATSDIPAKNASTQAWRDYADTKGFETDDDISRTEIIAALAANGIPTE